jgi:hypothetical protein
MFASTTSDVNSFGLAGSEAGELALSRSALQVDGGSRRSLAFIDAGLSDVQGLMAGLQADTTVYTSQSATLRAWNAYPYNRSHFPSRNSSGTLPK